MNNDLPTSGKLTLKQEPSAARIQKKQNFLIAYSIIGLAIDAGMNRLGLISEQTMLVVLIAIAVGTNIVGAVYFFRLRQLKKIEKLQTQQTQRIETSDR